MNKNETLVSQIHIISICIIKALSIKHHHSVKCQQYCSTIIKKISTVRLLHRWKATLAIPPRALVSTYLTKCGTEQQPTRITGLYCVLWWRWCWLAEGQILLQSMGGRWTHMTNVPATKTFARYKNLVGHKIFFSSFQHDRYASL